MNDVYVVVISIFCSILIAELVYLHVHIVGLWKTVTGLNKDYNLIYKEYMSLKHKYKSKGGRGK